MPKFNKDQEPLFAREGLFRQKLNQLRTTGNLSQQRTLPPDSQSRYKELEQGSYLQTASANFVKSDPQHAEKVALLDGVTELYNKTTIDRIIKDEWKRAKRYKHDLTILSVSIDGLDEISRSHGQNVSDSILRGVANFLMSCIRDVDIPSRYDVNTFLIVCPETDAKGVSVLADRVKSKILLTRVSDIGQNWHVSVSQGIASYPEQATTVDDLMNHTIMACNQAKNAGGNQFITFDLDSI